MKKDEKRALLCTENSGCADMFTKDILPSFGPIFKK